MKGQLGNRLAADDQSGERHGALSASKEWDKTQESQGLQVCDVQQVVAQTNERQ
jgi:hypothetical protein